MEETMTVHEAGAQRSADDALVLAWLRSVAQTEAAAVSASQVCVGVQLRKRRIWTALYRLTKAGAIRVRPSGKKHRNLYWV
jgi:hypothetical protein